jgi:ArsR family transcriptional regulator, nickel/cobalt-responsive transcriptional repressor
MASRATPADDRSRYLKALSDPERLRIVEHLRAGPRSVGRLARDLRNRVANVSHHLGLLRQAGVVVATKKGRFVIYELAAGVRAGGDASSFDFGCCRVDLGGGGGRASAALPSAAPTADEALRQINRILSRGADVTRRTKRRVCRKAPVRGGGGPAIAIDNPSFEVPATSFFDTAVEGWEKEGDPSATGVFFNAPDDAVFRGSRFVANADGSQLAAIAARRPEAPAAPAALHQVLNVAFEPGVTYELSLGVGISSIQPPTGEPPPVLRLALTYRDNAGRRREAGGASAATQGLRSDALARLALRVTVPKTGSALAGRAIGILITTAPNHSRHDGHFVFDDVTLRRMPS